MADAGKLSVRAKADMRAVIAGSGVQDVIACSDVMRLLSCQTTKARQVLKMMEDTGLIKTVQGKGKGKYILALPEFSSKDKTASEN